MRQNTAAFLKNIAAFFSHAPSLHCIPYKNKRRERWVEYRKRFQTTQIPLTIIYTKSAYKAKIRALKIEFLRANRPQDAKIKK